MSIFPTHFAYKNAWIILDLVLLALTTTVVFSQVAQNSVADPLIQQVTINHYEYINISKFITWKYVNNILSSLLVFLITLRILRILNCSDYFGQYLIAFAQITKNILSFLPPCLIIFFAFAMVFNLTFGNYLFYYQTFWTSSISLLIIILSMTTYPCNKYIIL